MEKLNITSKYKTPEDYIKDIKYDILIHQSKYDFDQSTKSLNNDLASKRQMVRIGTGEVKKILITKSKMDLISTEENPCVTDDTSVTRLDCRLKLVSDCLESALR